MVDGTRHLPAIAALEAAIPDAAALVFASLGIALALHGEPRPAGSHPLAGVTGTEPARPCDAAADGTFAS
jgi:hypothetical protein